MIEKIINLNEVGKLRNATTRGAISLGKVNIIYADNAMGKTTFCHVLRSLVKGDNELLLDWQTRSSPDKPRVSLLIDEKDYTFEDSSWSELFSDIEIFDSTFIDKNVYSGNEIKHAHKKNLGYYIFGETGVVLAERVDELKEAIRKINTEISDKRKIIEQHIVDDFSFENFMNLSVIENVEKAIKAQNKVIRSFESAAAIIERPLFAQFSLIHIDVEGLESRLAESIENITKDVEAKITAHAEMFKPHVEKKWLEEGLEYESKEVCPFCGQSIKKNHLIIAYNAFFSEAYKELKARIRQHLEILRQSLSGKYLRDIQGVASMNDVGIEFWKQHIPGEFPVISWERLEGTISSVWEAIREIFERKLREPLDEIEMTGELKATIDEYEALLEDVNEYCKKVDATNKVIQAQKDSLEKGDLVQERRKLTRLKNAQLKSKPFMVKLIKKYKSLTEERTKLGEQKDGAKVKLDTYKEEIMPKYQNSVNDVLAKSGAGFRIAEVKGTYIGGGARSEYQLMIDGVRSEMEDVCFLSDGDKRALAFAFFLSCLEEHPDLSDKVIVLDDPMTSFDRNRRRYTRQQVLDLARRAEQVIVLTHDTSFALMLWKALPEVKVLQIRREGNYGVFDEWNIVRETRDEYLKNYFELLDYNEGGAGGDLLKIARSIRPLLEGYLRFRFPDKFPANVKNLGKMLERIRNTDIDSELPVLGQLYGELNDINEYCVPFHHSDPSQDDTNVTDGELRPYVERTLTIVRGA